MYVRMSEFYIEFPAWGEVQKACTINVIVKGSIFPQLYATHVIGERMKLLG